LTTTFKVTKINYLYLAGSNSLNPTNDQLAPRTQEHGKARGKPKAMQYFQRFRIALTSNSRATSIFSFVLEGEPVILSTINEYMEQLQVDAANTGEQREVRKAKVIADLLTVLSQLSTNPQEVVDPDKVLDQWLVIECLRDT